MKFSKKKKEEGGDVADAASASSNIEVNIEEGIIAQSPAQDQSLGATDNQHGSKKLSMPFFYRNLRPSVDDATSTGANASSHTIHRSRSEVRASRPSVKECLGETVPDEEMADLTLDVYNMFFLSDICSQGFVYSFATLFVKMALYILILVDLRHNKTFPFQEQILVDESVIFAQFFLIPVAIVTQEELLTSVFIFSHLKYSPEIKIRHPGAKKWKFIIAHTARLIDGLMFLIINTCVMLLQKKDVLGLFLNFAALMFLQEIDNIALKVCLDGYWTRSLEEAAQDVVDMKFAKRHHYTHKCMKTFFVVLVWSGMLFVWGNVHWNNGRYCPLSSLC